jgi:ABC-type nickel/cobalt efflux system permease component RcnA
VRREIGTVLIGVAIAVALGIAIALWADVLANSRYSNGGSNLLGIVGTVPLIAALAVAAWTRWHRTCAVRYCLRSGEHPVAGTLQKVCSHHHTKEHHERVYDRHHAEHVASGRLDFGQSHEQEQPRDDRTPGGGVTHPPSR